VKTTSHSWFARQGSPEVFITYRTHAHGGLFRRKGLLAGLLPDPFCGRLAAFAAGADGRSAGAVAQAANPAGSPRDPPVLLIATSQTRVLLSRASAIAPRDNILTVVLGGELAVPCTRNPLQRG